MKTLTISTAHSENFKKKDQKIELEVTGGSPYYGYVWINDVMHTIYLTQTDSEDIIEIKPNH